MQNPSVGLRSLFVAFVVDAGIRHFDSENSAESIADVMSYLLADSSSLSRNLCQIFKVCCLVMRRPASSYLDVVFSLHGCAVSASVISSCYWGCTATSVLRTAGWVLFKPADYGDL